MRIGIVNENYVPVIHTPLRVYTTWSNIKNIQFFFLLWDFGSDVEHSAQCLAGRSSQNKVGIDVIINYCGENHLIVLSC